MKIENKQNISRMPKEIAINKLPYCVLKILNGARVFTNFQGKKDVVNIEFDETNELLHIEDYLNVKVVADNIYNTWIISKKIESSYQTLNHTMTIHELAVQQIKNIYDLRFNGKKKIIFIKGDDTGCGYWRMVLPARQLNERDFFIDVSTVEVVYEYLMEYDTIFVQRISDWNSFYVLQKLKEAGKKIIYDIDDNLFDLPSYHPAKNKFGNDAIESAKAVMLLSDRIVTTTEILRRTLIEWVGDDIENNIFVIPNAIDFENYTSRDIYPIRGNEVDKPFRILWSGSATHEQDFSEVIDALDEFLYNHQEDNVRLMIMGYLPICIRKKYAEKHWNKKIEYVEFRNIETYFKMISNVHSDIGIAPLVNCEFNRNKSNIKWQEYTIADIPTFASDMPPYSNTIKNKHDGLLLNSKSDWLSAFESKFQDREGTFWSDMVFNARNKIQREYNIYRAIDKWTDIF